MTRIEILTLTFFSITAAHIGYTRRQAKQQADAHQTNAALMYIIDL